MHIKHRLLVLNKYLMSQSFVANGFYFGLDWTLYFKAIASIASFPGSFRGRGKEPGTHCLRMHSIKI